MLLRPEQSHMPESRSDSDIASVHANLYADVHNTCLTHTHALAWCSKHLSKCMHTLRHKCTCTRACAPMQRCRNFFAMEAIANLSWVLREHRAGCCLPPALATRPALSTKPFTRCCSFKKSIQIHPSSWRGRRCSVAQASFDHPRWCRPHPVCLWVALELGRRPHPPTKFYFCHGFCGLCLIIADNCSAVRAIIAQRSICPCHQIWFYLLLVLETVCQNPCLRVYYLSVTM